MALIDEGLTAVDGWTGSRIKSLRELRGWTQQELAHELGVSLASLWAWETDQRPANKTVCKLLDLLE